MGYTIRELLNALLEEAKDLDRPLTVCDSRTGEDGIAITDVNVWQGGAELTIKTEED